MTLLKVSPSQTERDTVGFFLGLEGGGGLVSVPMGHVNEEALTSVSD